MKKFACLNIFFLSCLSSLFCHDKIEIFIDYLWDAKNQDLFQYQEDQKAEDLPLLPRLRKELLSKGYDIESWQLDNYRSKLLSFSSIANMEDFFSYCANLISVEKIAKSDTKFWVFWSLGPKIRDLDFSKIPKEKLVLFMWEPKVVQKESHDKNIHKHFSKIFTWDDDLVDNQLYFKFYYPVLRSQISSPVPFQEKKFCTMINSRLTSDQPGELYSEREKIIQFFEDKVGVFDLYGKNWQKRKYINYKGPIDDKIETLKNYKYCICYENTKNAKGYITEKIFDCFAAGVIPIYLGPENITDYIPKSCFIDRRDFSDDQSLYNFLKSIDKLNYQKYIEAQSQYLQSKEAQKFSEGAFVENFLQIIKN